MVCPLHLLTSESEESIDLGQKRVRIRCVIVIEDVEIVGEQIQLLIVDGL